MYDSKEYIRRLTASTVPSMRYGGKEPFDAWKLRAREKLAELLACEADALHLFSPEATDNTLATFFKFFPQAIGKAMAEALTPAGNQMPQYRW